MYRTLFRSSRVRVAAFVIAGLWLLQPLPAKPPLAAPGPATILESEQTIVAVLAADAAGRTTALADGFFVKGDVVATSYAAIRRVKDVSSLRIKLAGRDHLETVKQIAAFDESLDVALLALSSSVGLPYYLSASERVALGETVHLPAQSGTPAGTPLKATLDRIWNHTGHCFLVISPRVTNTYGGPVINSDNKLIGIIVRPPDSDESVNYAVHVSLVADLIARVNRPGGAGAEASRRSGNCLDEVVKDYGPPPPPPPRPSDTMSPPKIIRKSGRLFQESATRRFAPSYPEEAKEAGVSGAVVVEVTVDEQGNVIAARAISGHSLLKDAAVAAARQWRFKPTTLSGIPVKVIGTITFNFNL
jgi:TonB family protein